MSSEEFTPKCCGCIPARRGIAALALFCFLVTFWDMFWYMAFENQTTHKDIPCWGSDCPSTFSCAGTSAWSYHLMVVVAFIVGFMFAPMGFIGILQGNAGFVTAFMFALYALAIVRAIVLIWDLIQTLTCKAYTYNIISDMYAYPGGLGLNTATKDQLFNMNVLPVEAKRTRRW